MTKFKSDQIRRKKIVNRSQSGTGLFEFAAGLLRRSKRSR